MHINLNQNKSYHIMSYHIMSYQYMPACMHMCIRKCPSYHLSRSSLLEGPSLSSVNSRIFSAILLWKV